MRPQTWIQFGTAVILFISAAVSAYSFWTTRQRQTYDYLARLWYDLNKLGFEHPEFLDHEKTANYETAFGDQQRRLYENYARMYWGYVYDIWEQDFVRGYRYTIKRTKTLHYAWFERNVNEQSYDKEFIKYINDIS